MERPDMRAKVIRERLQRDRGQGGSDAAQPTVHRDLWREKTSIPKWSEVLEVFRRCSGGVPEVFRRDHAHEGEAGHRSER